MSIRAEGGSITPQEDFQRFNSVLDVTTERMQLAHGPTDVLDDRFLTNLRQYLLEAGATPTDLKIIAVRIVTGVRRWRSLPAGVAKRVRVPELAGTRERD